VNPITFQRSKHIAKSPAGIAAEIADTARWSEFPGYGFLPGIERAQFEVRTDDMTGSRVRVYNSDGSQHVEEIIIWQPEQRIVMKLQEFTPPLSRLATHFIEEWNFVPQNGVTHVTRKFKMYPAQPLTRPLLWFISLFFRKAVEAHLEDMALAPTSSP
jgi:hypothetical protein